MESAYMKDLIRKVGKSYKDIYSQKDKYGWIDMTKVTKDLVNKYVSMEKIVLYNHKHDGAENDSEALTITYHGLSRDFGGRLHLQFDEDEPILHLISYATDVADYNIKNHVLFEGANYSPTTNRHMTDFECLFPGKKVQVTKGTGHLVHSKIVGDYMSGLSIDMILTNSTQELNLVDSFSQSKVFDDLFVNIYKMGQSHNVYKYQCKQMTEMVLGAFNLFDDSANSDGMRDMLLAGKLDNKTVLSALLKMFNFMDKHTPESILFSNKLKQSVCVNTKGFGVHFKVRNFNSSYDTLKDAVKLTLCEHHVFDKVSA